MTNISCHGNKPIESFVISIKKGLSSPYSNYYKKCINNLIYNMLSTSV